MKLSKLLNEVGNEKFTVELRNECYDYVDQRGYWVNGKYDSSLNKAIAEYGIDVFVSYDEPSKGTIKISLRCGKSKDSSEVLYITDDDKNITILNDVDYNKVLDNLLRKIEIPSKAIKSTNPDPLSGFKFEQDDFPKEWKELQKSKNFLFIDSSEQYDNYGETFFKFKICGGTSTVKFYSEYFNIMVKFIFDDANVFTYEGNVEDIKVKGESVDGISGAMTLCESWCNQLAKEKGFEQYRKDFVPECYKLWVYFREDFYASNSKKIWKTIEGKLENGSNFSDSNTQDYVDDKAAVWECVYIEDLKVVLDYLTRKHPDQKILIQKDGKDVTSAFWKNKADKTGNEETTPKKDLKNAGLIDWAKAWKGKVEKNIPTALGDFYECIGDKRFGVAGRKLTSYYFFVGEKFYVDDGHGKAWLHKDADVAYALNRIITALLKAK